VEYETHAPIFGDPLIVVNLDCERPPARPPPGAIRVGVDRAGSLPSVDEQWFDLLLTGACDPPRPWIGASALESALAALRNAVRARPLASSVLAQVLLATHDLPFTLASCVESFAYSTLLGGREFLDWRRAHPARPLENENAQRVQFSRRADTALVRLANPRRHNAIDARMRDELCEALRAVADDPSTRALEISAEGRAFSVGGELEEFGTTPDLATAHAIRTLRSPALLLHELRAQAVVFVHGACIGSGIEIAAAAGRIVAESASWFGLPEISMGLIPGAGGTVTLPARIGRHRTLYWALRNRRLSATTALAWGLIDEIRRS